MCLGLVVLWYTCSCEPASVVMASFTFCSCQYTDNTPLMVWVCAVWLACCMTLMGSAASLASAVTGKVAHAKSAAIHEVRIFFYPLVTWHKASVKQS